MWLERSIGSCQDNLGFTEMRGGMIVFQIHAECLKMTTTNFYEISVCEQNICMKINWG